MMLHINDKQNMSCDPSYFHDTNNSNPHGCNELSSSININELYMLSHPHLIMEIVKIKSNFSKGFRFILHILIRYR